MKHSSIRNCQFTFCPTEGSPSKKFLSHIICIDTLLRDKRPLHPLRRYSDGGLLRSLSEHERKPFGACSQRLGNTNQKASEQTADSITLFCAHILPSIKRICKFQPHISVFILALCTCLLLSNCSSDPEIIPDDDETENPVGDSETEEPEFPAEDEDYGTCVYDANAPIGFATVESTPTGGAGGTHRIVTTANELRSALSSSEPLIIYIKGEIEVTSMIQMQVINKTILGLPGSVLTNPNRTANGSGILYFRQGSNNIIMRNVTFKSAGAYDVDGRDNLCIHGTTNIWIDHCDFQDGVDGNFDCRSASDNIAVTWCRFRYLIEPLAGGSGGSDDHRFSNLWGSSDNETSDRGHLKTTFQYCWWDEGCRERMPRVRFGQIHIANCLYNSSVANYCIGLGVEADVYVENTVFNGARRASDDRSDGTAAIRFDGCSFPDIAQNDSYTDISTAFTPPYTLTNTIPAEQVKEVVSTYAGATLTISEPQ